jgi:CheY-like chemotaxis protein/HEAT repeat protein
MKKQILVVDDEIGALTLIGIMCERVGYSMLKARNGFSALAVLDQTTPDMIILDVMMPKMNGIELCRIIRSREDTGTVPILICSARGDSESVMLCMEAGANDHVPKPILHDDLVAAVRRLFDETMDGERNTVVLNDYEGSTGPKTLTTKDDTVDTRLLSDWIQALGNANADVRGTAVVNLSKLRRETDILKGTPAQDAFWRNVFHSLGSLVTHEAVVERWAVMADLALILTKPETEQNIELLSIISASKSVEIRRAALDALGLNKHLPALNILENNVNDLDDSIRRTAIQALGNLGDESSIEIIQKGLPDSEASVRFAAINSLAQIGTDKAIDILEDMLKNVDRQTRQYIVRAFLNIEPVRAIEILLPLADTEKNNDVLYLLATTLGELGDPKAKAVLEKLAKHESEHVQEGAKKALENLNLSK